jgi:aminoglycoside/choline kinase family phosphotransferase
VASLAIPTDLEAVDAAWLSWALGVAIVGVAPGGPVGGIAVTSRVARLRLESDPPGAAPDSVVVKVANPAWTHGPALHEREVRFYRQFAAGRDLPAPRCYHADFDPATGAFVLVLEDLGDAIPGHRLEGLDPGEAEAVARGLADLHRAWWGRVELRDLEVRGHGADRVARTLETFADRWPALEASGKYPIDGELRRVLPGALDRYAAGMLAISSEPQTLIHADAHLENFFLEATPDGLRLILIDWQNPCFGHCAFDVSHVISSLKPEHVAASREPVLSAYHQRLGRHEVPLERLALDVAAAVRHQFIGSASWFATFEAERLRDAATIQGHWARLSAALIASESAIG